MRNVLYAAVDVDDNAYHVCVVGEDGREVAQFACKPTSSILSQKLKQISDAGMIRVCYEATYIGFSLARALKKVGIECQVIASSLIPSFQGHRQKNDRIDARKLAVFYAKGLLTPVQMPDEDAECERDLLRSRSFVTGQAARLKTHIIAICRRRGWDYRSETKKKSYWTATHIEWLETKASLTTNVSLKENLLHLLRLLRQTLGVISSYDEQISTLAQQAHYKAPVSSLICFRGLNEISAMTVVTELGDIRRFDHPKRVVAYAGLDVVEHSSGGKERRFGITKTGNKFIRKTLVEAYQFALFPPKISADLRRRRENADMKQVDIADRCMQRLHKKGVKLLYRDKPRNKIKVALAREMVGFIWESLRSASA